MWSRDLIRTYCAACGQLKLPRERDRWKADSRSDRANHGDEHGGVLHDADGNDFWSDLCYFAMGLELRADFG